MANKYTFAAIRSACSRGRRAQALIDELDDWAGLARRGAFSRQASVDALSREVRDHLAELVGAQPGEVVAMNSLTVNLHLMMVSFYRPDARAAARS